MSNINNNIVVQQLSEMKKRTYILYVFINIYAPIQRGSNNT